MAGPNSISVNRTRTQALVAPRTMRRHSCPGLTSLPAGKSVPIAAYPVLREDAIRSGRIRMSFEMMETAEVLMNAVKVAVKAYFVPHLALERFQGSMDILNLSYEGKPPMEGEPVIPYIETAPFGAHGTNDVYRYLGFHGRADQLVNTSYLESYNLIQNFRRKNRSPDLPLRTRLQSDLAEAFWNHELFAHIVPDFDQAAVDGEVPLNVVNNAIFIKGIGRRNNSVATYQEGIEVRETLNEIRTYGAGISGSDIIIETNGTPDGAIPFIFGEMQENGITVSLSNIEMARKTQAFAKIRQQYNMHDDHIINLLMDAITIPDQAFKQPMLIGERETIFGMSKRYASDSGNLTESVVNGMTQLEMSIQLPRVGVGGVVMIIAEITPDQLFERQEDPWLHTTSVEELPQYLRDTLDPEKVDVVQNSRIDVAHSTPDGTFGYEPLNARWQVKQPRVGGRFYRPTANTTFDEDRQRIWAVETINPTLSTDFYLCTNMHTKPFVVTNQDPFEVVTQGEVWIEGNTVFGGHLIEATDDYDKVIAEAPQARIEKEV